MLEETKMSGDVITNVKRPIEAEVEAEVTIRSCDLVSLSCDSPLWLQGAQS